MAGGFPGAVGAGLVQGGVSSLATAAYRSALYKSNQGLPNAIPSPGELLQAIIQGQLDIGEYGEAALAHGFVSKLGHPERYRFQGRPTALMLGDAAKPSDGTPWDRIVWASTWAPSLDLLLELKRRGYIDDTLYNYWCRRLGINQAMVPQMLEEVANYIPPVQDLVRFAVREVFNPVLRTQLGLDEEYDQNIEFDLWAMAKGLTDVKMTTPSGVTLERNFAADYWAAHWQLPSPQQLYEMFHRLRPGRVQHWAVGGIIPQPVDLAFLRNALKANDYAPIWRERLTAIAYRVPGRIDIRRMLGLGIIDSGECTELYKDLGYSDTDARTLTQLAERLGPWKPTIPRAAKWFTTGRIDRVTFSGVLDTHGVPSEYRPAIENDAYTNVPMGTLVRWRRKRFIDDQEFLDRAGLLGYTDEDAETFRKEAISVSWTRYVELARQKILEATRLGVMTDDDARQRLTRLGMSAEEAETALQVIKLENQNDLVKKAISAIHTGYLRGEWTEADARVGLQQVGVNASRINQYIALWRIEFSAKRKQLSADRVIKALARGLIGQAEAEVILNNLGYDGTAIRVLMAVGTQDLQEAVALASLYSAQTGAVSAQAAVRLIKEQDRIRDRARKALATHGTTTQLRTWLKQGLIGRDEVYRRFRSLGWPDADTDRFLTANGQTASGQSASGPP